MSIEKGEGEDHSQAILLKWADAINVSAKDHIQAADHIEEGLDIPVRDTVGKSSTNLTLIDDRIAHHRIHIEIGEGADIDRTGILAHTHISANSQNRESPRYSKGTAFGTDISGRRKRTHHRGKPYPRRLLPI